MYCFDGCHAGVLSVCCLLSFNGTSPHAWICGDRLVARGFDCREVFAIDISFTCRVDEFGFALLCLWVVCGVRGLLGVPVLL